MKKQTIIIRTVALLLMAGAATFVSCSKDDDPAASGNIYTMTVNASKGDRATKDLSLDGTTLTATWKAGEEVTVYNETRSAALTGTLVAQSDGASTVLKGALTGTIEAGDELTLKFLSPNYTSQEGTIEWIADNCDYATATVTVDAVDNGRITTTADAEFENHQAIVKFTLMDDISGDALSVNPFSVTVDATTYTVTPSSATSELYVALPGFNSEDILLSATVGGVDYMYKRSGITFSDGQYYTIAVKMYRSTLNLSTITAAYTAKDGQTLAGTLGTGVQISIADRATVSLNNVNINKDNNLSGTFHGLNCLGDATIILYNNNNYVRASCSYGGRAGIYVPRYKTLTFQSGNSSGRVEATGAGEAAGIGGYSGNHCGAIVVNSGKVTGVAGCGENEDWGEGYSAGIGSSAYNRCDGITINGGQVWGQACESGNAAGIGTGYSGICRRDGDTQGTEPAITINIEEGDGWVKATKGSSATYFIGGGQSKCGIVSINGNTFVDGNGNKGITSSSDLPNSDYSISGNVFTFMPW